MAAIPPENGPPPLLSLRHVSKSFRAVAALAHAHLDLYAGEAHGLVGENGAGKSTLVKILAGVHTPDGGSLTLDGQPLVFTGPAAALAAGIAVIYQEPTLFPDLSVAENIFVTDDLAAAQEAMARTDVNARWQAEMAPFFVDNADGLRGIRVLDEVFNLDTQLGRTGAH